VQGFDQRGSERGSQQGFAAGKGHPAAGFLVEHPVLGHLGDDFVHGHSAADHLPRAGGAGLDAGTAPGAWVIASGQGTAARDDFTKGTDRAAFAAGQAAVFHDDDFAA